MKKIFVTALLLMTLLMATAFAEAPAAEVPAYEGPYIVTTCGQSPGAVLIEMAVKNANKDVNIAKDNSLTAEDLKAGDYKTLVVTTGTSMKGMGAAGTDVNAEIERCLQLIEAAKEAGMVVIGAHVEGMARRTDSSDEASIDAVMELADIVLVIDDSDSDGFFTKYAEEHELPLIKVKDALAVGSVFQ